MRRQDLDVVAGLGKTCVALRVGEKAPPYFTILHAPSALTLPYVTLSLLFTSHPLNLFKGEEVKNTAS